VNCETELGNSPYLVVVEDQAKLEAHLATLLYSNNFRLTRIKFPLCVRVSDLCASIWVTAALPR
jgi:hypothetical protein